MFLVGHVSRMTRKFINRSNFMVCRPLGFTYKAASIFVFTILFVLLAIYCRYQFTRKVAYYPMLLSDAGSYEASVRFKIDHTYYLVFSCNHDAHIAPMSDIGTLSIQEPLSYQGSTVGVSTESAFQCNWGRLPDSASYALKLSVTPCNKRMFCRLKWQKGIDKVIKGVWVLETCP